MSTLSNIYQVTKAQYDTLVSGGTVGSHTYDSTALYLVQDDGQVDSSMSATSTNAVQNKVVKEYIDNGMRNKQATLISGTNIKTINGESLLGSGDIAVSGGSGGGALIFNATLDEETTDIGISAQAENILYIDVEGGTDSGVCFRYDEREGLNGNTGYRVKGTIISHAENSELNLDTFFTAMCGGEDNQDQTNCSFIFRPFTYCHTGGMFYNDDEVTLLHCGSRDGAIIGEVSDGATINFEFVFKTPSEGATYCLATMCYPIMVIYPAD